MHRLARKASVCTRVVERHGLRFAIHRYRRRIGIAVGAVLFAAFLIGSQQFVWAVKIEGCQQLEEQILRNVLEELGVGWGVPKKSIDTREVQQQITLKVKELSWAALNLQGTTATLVIRERTPPPAKIDTDLPANVVAAQDGQIKRMRILDGKAVLKEGDTVRAGEIIVSGINEDRWGLTHLVRANAQVIAHVSKTIEVEIPLSQEHLNMTGELIKRNYLDIFGVRLPLFLYSGLEGEYKLEKRSNTPTVFGVELPFDITRESYIFFEREERTITEETALHLAKQQLQRREKELPRDAIIRADSTAVVENGILKLTGEYIVEADIAKQVEIPIFDREKEQKPKKIREGGY